MLIMLRVRQLLCQPARVITSGSTLSQLDTLYHKCNSQAAHILTVHACLDTVSHAQDADQLMSVQILVEHALSLYEHVFFVAVSQRLVAPLAPLLQLVMDRGYVFACDGTTTRHNAFNRDGVATLICFKWLIMASCITHTRALMCACVCHTLARIYLQLHLQLNWMPSRAHTHIRRLQHRLHAHQLMTTRHAPSNGVVCVGLGCSDIGLVMISRPGSSHRSLTRSGTCLLYTSDAADE
mgnify:CR=1 FL=1